MLLSEALILVAVVVLLVNFRSLPFMYHVRLGLALLWAKITKPRLSENEEIVQHFRVWIDDLDINMHQNNSVYNKHCDTGRAEFLLRTVGTIRGNYRFANAGVTLFFLRELKLLQPYEIRTRLVGWNQKWLVLEQSFFSYGKRHALGCNKIVVKEKGGNKTVSPEVFFREIGWNVEKLRRGLPKADAVITHMLTFEESLLQAYPSNFSHHNTS